MKRVAEYQIVDHGPDGESYFPGCGVAFTRFDEVFSGIGDTAGEALADALNQASESCDLSSQHSAAIDNEWLEAEWANRPAARPGEEVGDEWHYYVSIRVKFE